MHKEDYEGWDVMEVGRKKSGAVSWTHEREAKLHCLFLRSFF